MINDLCQVSVEAMSDGYILNSTLNSHHATIMHTLEWEQFIGSSSGSTDPFLNDICSLALLFSSVAFRDGAQKIFIFWQQGRPRSSPSFLIVSADLFALRPVFPGRGIRLGVDIMASLVGLWCKSNPSDSSAKKGMIYYTAGAPPSPSSISMHFSLPGTQYGVLSITSRDAHFIWICLFCLDNNWYKRPSEFSNAFSIEWQKYHLEQRWKVQKGKLHSALISSKIKME